MLVRARWNVKDALGWHRAGEVWETDTPAEGMEPLDAVAEFSGERTEPAEQPKPRATRRKKTAE